MVSTENAIATNIAIIQEPGHNGPWISALSQAPSRCKALDYGLGWGIEAHVLGLRNQGRGRSG